MNLNNHKRTLTTCSSLSLELFVIRCQRRLRLIRIQLYQQVIAPTNDLIHNRYKRNSQKPDNAFMMVVRFLILHTINGEITMRHIITLLIITCISVFSLTACSGDDEANHERPEEQTTV